MTAARLVLAVHERHRWTPHPLLLAISRVEQPELARVVDVEKLTVSGLTADAPETAYAIALGEKRLGRPSIPFVDAVANLVVYDPAASVSTSLVGENRTTVIESQIWAANTLKELEDRGSTPVTVEEQAIADAQIGETIGDVLGRVVYEVPRVTRDEKVAARTISDLYARIGEVDDPRTQAIAEAPVRSARASRDSL